MNASPGEKVLGTELLVSFTAEWLIFVAIKGEAPSPRQVLATPIAFAMLALVAAVGGPNVARVAAGIGGIVALVIVLKAFGTTPGGEGAVTAAGRPSNPALSAIVTAAESGAETALA
jgi:hypothetical protein